MKAKPFQKGNTFGARNKGRPKSDSAPEIARSAMRIADRIARGTHKEMLMIEDPNKRLDFIIKAVGHLIKLVPARLVDAKGNAVSIEDIKASDDQVQAIWRRRMEAMNEEKKKEVDA